MEAYSADSKLPFTLTSEEYAKFCEYFYRKTGIFYEVNKKYYVERRIADRVIKTDSVDFQEYFSVLRFQFGGNELQHIVNSLTVNETYFFREDYQFDALVNGIMPELARSRRNGEPIRIWSLPCSSGEEPYSIAINILEFWDQADQWNIEIYASDIDSKILNEAQRGIYGTRSLGRVPAHLKSKYFVRYDEDNMQICKELRESIDFSLVNIMDPLQMRRLADINVIFCRNLLIYFDDVARREAVDLLFETMAPGGYICLGHSESMSRMSSLFLPRKFGDTLVYQKPLNTD